MKKNIHPNYREVIFQDSITGKQFKTRSTAEARQTVRWTDKKEYPLVKVEVSSDSHPAFTGKTRVATASSRVEAFRKKYAK